MAFDFATVRPASRSRGGVKSRHARSLNGYATMQEYKGKWRVRWRWRFDTRWHNGSVLTEDEAREWVESARAALAAGDRPPELPHHDLRDEAVRPNILDMSPERVASRAALAAMLANPVRCRGCGLLLPCDLCITDVRAEMRTARRGEP